MSERDGLVVVVPRGFDHLQIEALLDSRRDWIERACARLDASRRRLEAEPPCPPTHIVLPAVAEEWVVEYRPGSLRTVTAAARESPGQRLIVTGAVDDPQACREALRRWLRRRARRALVPRLVRLAGLHGLEFGRVSVRQQRTRWGSCSRRKTISLSSRLLFLPPAVVDHVLLHELCHTVEMNHSPRFWALLQSGDPRFRAHRRLLRGAQTLIPTWIDHEIEGPAG